MALDLAEVHHAKPAAIRTAHEPWDDGWYDHIDADGIRIFFYTPPFATEGTGTITVANADGMAPITSESEYFAYPQALSPGKTSLPRTWRFNVPATVTAFTFSVYVAARTANDHAVEPGLHIAASTISAGTQHSCAITLDSKAYCWGSGMYGVLGNGDTSNAPLPTLVQTTLIFASVATLAPSHPGDGFRPATSSFAEYTIALRNDGTARADHAPLACTAPRA